MLPSRLIPILLIDRNRRVVKTVGFGERTYIGDPFNIIRLFNEKQVDEICVLDIDATPQHQGPDFDFVASLAAECFMPMSYGGGISKVDHARRLISDGIEKVVLRSNASDKLIGEINHEFGAQAVVGCIDYRMSHGQRVVQHSNALLEKEARRLASAGVGELILQSVDNDGARTGMDVATIAELAPTLPVPVIALGGAGDVAHLNAAIHAGADAAASGSTFCFIGRLRAVLVTYPDYSDRQKMLST
jgi:cyclase